MTITEMKTTTETIWQDTKKVTMVEESQKGGPVTRPRTASPKAHTSSSPSRPGTGWPKHTPFSAGMVEILTSTDRGTEFDIHAWLSQRIHALNHSHSYQTPLIVWKSL